MFFAPLIVADHMQKKIGKLRPAKTVPKIMIIKGGKRIKLHKKQGHLKKFQGEADK